MKKIWLLIVGVLLIGLCTFLAFSDKNDNSLEKVKVADTTFTSKNYMS